MARLRDDLFEIWYNQEAQRTTASLNPFLSFLLLISLLYRFAIRIRRFLFQVGLFRIRELACPVVSVGNISVGGTGKTPAVIALAALFQSKGYRPAVLSRGYGGEGGKGSTPVSDCERILIGPDRAGDEPYLMASALPGIPVITGRNRFFSGDLAIRAFGADILFLDDAFQHWSLKRDVDIVLLNAAAPFGNGFLLPRGPLRETENSLARADAVILTGSDPDAAGALQNTRSLRENLPGIPVLTARYRLKGLVRNGEAHAPDLLRGKKVFAFCGLANPGSFRNSIEKTGAEIVFFLSYPDHFHYTRRDADEIASRAQASGADFILSTEKDGVKLAAFPDFFSNLILLRIELEFSPEGVLTDLIEDRIKTWKKPEQRHSSLRSSD